MTPRVAYDELLTSNVWDKRFDLPTVASAANPHIYAAYVVRILESFDSGETVGSYEFQSLNRAGATMIRNQYKTFLLACEKEPGLITTFPGDRAASHDDAHGAAFLNRAFAGRCVDYLAEHDGSYTTDADSESHNAYRFLFFLPSLKAHARFRVGVFTQIQFILSLLGNLWFTKDETDGQLLLWLAFPAMRKFPLVSAFIDYWSETWTKRGCTPYTIFKLHYLKESPWFGEWARDDWK